MTPTNSSQNRNHPPVVTPLQASPGLNERMAALQGQMDQRLGDLALSFFVNTLGEMGENSDSPDSLQAIEENVQSLFPEAKDISSSFMNGAREVVDSEIENAILSGTDNPRVQKIARARIAKDTQKLKTRMNLVERRTGRDLEAIKAHTCGLKSEMKLRIQIAARDGIEPWDVTDDAIKAEKEAEKARAAKAQEEAFNELMAMDDEPVKKKKGGSKQPKRAQPGQKASKREKSTPQPPPTTIHKKTEKVKPAALVTLSPEALFAAQKVSDKIAPRVARWQTKGLDNIRRFEDRGVKQYASMDEKSLLEMRRRHHLPGLEKIHENEKLRSTYCFRTRTGYGMFAELQFKGQTLSGVVRVGRDTSADPAIIYHRYFEAVLATTTIQQIFNPASTPGHEGVADEWVPVGTVAKVDTSQVMTLTFENEDYTLRVLPL